MRKPINDGLTKDQRHRLKNPEAYRAKKREYIKTPEERERRRLHQARWREKNRAHYNAWARENHRKNREKILKRTYGYYVKHKYGLTAADYVALSRGQGDCCAICKAKPMKRRLHIDHCHTTGKVRGLLCAGCNTKLGWYEVHHAAADHYLKHGLVTLI
jgi:hypothetical protein